MLRWPSMQGGDEMARPAVRLAVEKLPPEERARDVG